MGNVAGTITGLDAALGVLTQLGGERLVLSCSTKPGVFGAHEICAKPGAAGTIVSVGIPGVCTAVGKAQKPPVISDSRDYLDGLMTKVESAATRIANNQDRKSVV